MDAGIVEALLAAKRKLGDDLTAHAREVDALLADSLRDSPGERLLLRLLLEEGIPEALDQAPDRAPDDAALAELARRMAEKWLLDPVATHQAVRIWHYVMRTDPARAAAPCDMARILGPAAADSRQNAAPAKKTRAFPFFRFRGLAMVLLCGALGSGWWWFWGRDGQTAVESWVSLRTRVQAFATSFMEAYSAASAARSGPRSNQGPDATASAPAARDSAARERPGELGQSGPADRGPEMRETTGKAGADRAGESAARPAALSAPSPLSTHVNSIDMEFVLIPAGSFIMGSPDGEEAVCVGLDGRVEKGCQDWIKAEQPRHRVTISRAFYLGRYPVTQRQWEAVMDGNPSHFKGDGNRPVESVSWHDAQEFIRRLNEREGHGRYHLPSEAEWEYAARAGTNTRYSFGDEPGHLGRYAWFAENSGGSTSPVGRKEPNAWGLYDMYGNVWEWVQDRWGPDYYSASALSDPGGPTIGAQRVLRGGSWFNTARYCRSTIRYREPPDGRNRSFGFRLALSTGE